MLPDQVGVHGLVCSKNVGVSFSLCSYEQVASPHFPELGRSFCVIAYKKR